MRVLGVCGLSGAGKTTLMEALIAGLRQRGLRVSVIKHAHHRFDIDHPGKDSWRHRQAGAGEVLVANSHRLALMREYLQPQEPTVDALLAELSPCDWVLVEGFKHGALPKLEVWRAEAARPGDGPRYPQDDAVVGVVTDNPAGLPVVPAQPVLPLDEPDRVLAWLLSQGDRFLRTA